MAGGLDFTIGVEDVAPPGAGGQATAGARQPAGLTKEEWQDLVKQFGQEQARLILARTGLSPPGAAGLPAGAAAGVPGNSAAAGQMQRVEQTLLPVVAEVAPELAQKMHALGGGEALSALSADDMTEAVAAGLVQELREAGALAGEEMAHRIEEAVRAALRTPEPPLEAVAAGLLHEARAPDEKASAAATEPDEDAIAAALRAPVLTKELAESADAALVASVGREQGLPADTFGLATADKPLPVEVYKIKPEEELPLAEEVGQDVYRLLEDEQHGERLPLAPAAPAAAPYAAEILADEMMPEELPEAIDPYREAAQKRRQSEIESAKRQNAYDQMRAEERGETLEPAEAIDPNAEARQEHLNSLNKSLQGGARVAAQAGGVGGSLGEMALGAGDLVMGIGTADPIQAAIGGLQMVDAAADLTAAAFDAATEIMRSYVDYVGDLIDNNYIGAFEGRLEEVSSVLGKIPLVGNALASGFTALTYPIHGFLDISEDLLARGKQLADYSGPLAASNALAEVRGQLADIHEADVLGPDLARMTDAFSETMTELREMFLPFKEFLARNFADGWEWLLEKVQDLHALLVQIEAGMQDVPAILEALKPWSRTDLATVIKQMRDHMKKAADELERQRQGSEELPELDANLRPGQQQLPVFRPRPELPARRGLWEPTVEF